MRMYDIIKKKRDGGRLNKREIQFFIKNYVNGKIPDYQASALLMAIFYNKMTFSETKNLTLAMRDSGDTVDLSGINGVCVDKHSTGGVGDKTTLVVAPLVSACGGKVAKMSGRGLGHTGGTIDKLESIKGFKTIISREEFFDIVNRVGTAVIAQSGNLAPADKKLYALRDVTATVDSKPLIVSSIMSKKLASGAGAILLDVKCGSGAFMKTLEDAKELATDMVRIGRSAGKYVSAFITDMDIPLGNNIGNSLEVIEAIDTLRGNGEEDFRTLCLEISAYMLNISKNIPLDRAKEMVLDALNSGKALKVFRDMVEAQGGDVSYIDNPELFPKAGYSHEVLAPCSGYIVKLNAEDYGRSALALGAGRAKKEDSIDFSAGIVIDKKFGYVEKGERICTLYSNKPHAFKEAEDLILGATVIADEPVEKKPIILDIVH